MHGWLRVELLSAATFSAGRGLAGEVDVDVEQEPSGIPKIVGKTLKGLLVEECAAILDVFSAKEWHRAAARLFGTTNADTSKGILRIEDALLPDGVRRVADKAVSRQQHPLHPLQVLSTLTEVRQQTKIARTTGAPAETTLRSSRVVLPGLCLYARLWWLEPPSEREKALFAGSALMTRRAGLARNRGRGRLVCRCLDERGEDVTTPWLSPLMEKEVGT